MVSSTKPTQTPKNIAEQQTEKIEELLEVLEHHLQPSRKYLFKQFLRGIAFGLGTTLGVSIVLAVITFALSQLRTVPILDQIIIQTQVEQILTE